MFESKHFEVLYEKDAGKSVIEKIGSRASLKIHSYNLQPRFTSDFTLNLVNVARYTSQTQRKI